MTEARPYLLIQEYGAETARRVDVSHLPFTLGNTPRADVPIRSALGKVRLHVARYSDGYRAHNLTDGAPGERERSLSLTHGSKITTGGVTFQFFTAEPDIKTQGLGTRCVEVTRRQAAMKLLARSRLPRGVGKPRIYRCRAPEALLQERRGRAAKKTVPAASTGPARRGRNEPPQGVVVRKKSHREAPTPPGATGEASAREAPGKQDMVLLRITELLSRLEGLRQKIDRLPSLRPARSARRESRRRNGRLALFP